MGRGSEAGGTRDDLQRGILNVARELKIDLVVSGGGEDYAVSREGNLTHVSCGVPSGGSANWAEIQASPYELRVVRRSLTLQDSPAADHVFEVWLAAIREDPFALACLALAAGTPMLLILCGIGLLMGVRSVQETVVVGDVEDE